MDPERSRFRDLVTVLVVCVTCACPLALLLLDRGDPERRIERMYRP